MKLIQTLLFILFPFFLNAQYTQEQIEYLLSTPISNFSETELSDVGEFGAIDRVGVNWYMENKTFNTNDTVSLKVTVNGFVNITCFQYAFKFDTFKLRLITVNTSPITFTGALSSYGSGSWSWYGKPGYNLTPGEMRTVWSNPYGKTVVEGTHVYTIKFVAKASGSLQGGGFSCWVNHPIIKPTAYKFPLVSIPTSYTYLPPAQLEEGLEDRDVKISTIKVYPNPFFDYFSVSESGNLEIYNLQGQLIQKANYIADNQLYLNIPSGTYIVKINNNIKTLIKS